MQQRRCMPYHYKLYGDPIAPFPPITSPQAQVLHGLAYGLPPLARHERSTLWTSQCSFISPTFSMKHFYAVYWYCRRCFSSNLELNKTKLCFVGTKHLGNIFAELKTEIGKDGINMHLPHRWNGHWGAGPENLWGQRGATLRHFTGKMYREPGEKWNLYQRVEMPTLSNWHNKVDERLGMQ